MITVEQIRAVARGQINPTCEVIDTDDIRPLAQDDGAETYPISQFRLTIGDWTHELTAWHYYWYEEGPHREDTGEYIGDGWHWLCSDRDGQNRGNPSCADLKIMVGEGCLGQIQLPERGLTDDEIEIASSKINEALEDAYRSTGGMPEIDDSEIYEALMERPCQRVKVGDDVTIRISSHAGRGVMGIKDDSDSRIWWIDEADGCAEAARDMAIEALPDVAEITTEIQEALSDLVENA